MTGRTGDKESQPEDVSIVEDESIHSFLDGGEGPPWFRGSALPDNTEFARQIREYAQADSPEDYAPKLGPSIIEEAVEDRHSTDNVTVYKIRCFGDPDDSGMNVGVEYRIGHNFEAETTSSSV